MVGSAFYPVEMTVFRPAMCIYGDEEVFLKEAGFPHQVLTLCLSRIVCSIGVGGGGGGIPALLSTPGF